MLAILLSMTFACVVQPDDANETKSGVGRPTDTPRLHHVGLNSTDPARAAAWYLGLWPEAQLGQFAGQTAVIADMTLVINKVEQAPSGEYEPGKGRSVEQSAFWHIGAFVDTTDIDSRLKGLGIKPLPLFIRPDSAATVWRSGLAPYQGIREKDTLASFSPKNEAIPVGRDGGFAYVLGPDGALFELTGRPGTSPSLSHIHFFHEHPHCAANWYVTIMGMQHRRNSGLREGACQVPVGAPSWPSLEAQGTLRQPRGGVSYGNGNMSWYPRQCVFGRCGTDQALVTSRGQVLDHVGFSVVSIHDWHRWIVSSGARIIKPLGKMGSAHAFMFEGPDGLAIELVQLELTSGVDVDQQ